MLQSLITLWFSLFSGIVDSADNLSSSFDFSSSKDYTIAERDAICKALYGEYDGQEK